MKAGERLINNFYTRFQARDWKGMALAYHSDIFFYDPVFGNLEGPQVAAMWEMLLSRATELDMQFSDVVIDEGYGSCRWVASYIFSATGRKVVNKGKGRFKFEDGKIVEHFDDFSFWKWSSQALGWKGTWFGWSSLLRNAVRRRARRGLDRFMKK
jgi:SnoaL-like domain